MLQDFLKISEQNEWVWIFYASQIIPINEKFCCYAQQVGCLGKRWASKWFCHPAILSHLKVWGKASPSRCSTIDFLSYVLCVDAELNNSTKILCWLRWLCAFVLTQSNSFAQQNWASLKNTYSDDEVNMFKLRSYSQTLWSTSLPAATFSYCRDSQASGFPGKASPYT